MSKNVKRQFKELFEAYYTPLCNYAAAILKDKAAAEDIVQKLFIQCWEKNSFLEMKNTEAYLLRGAKYKCIDYLRARKAKVDHLESISADEVSVLQSDLKEENIIPLLHFFASSLPTKTREVFLLSRIEGYSNKEIADKLAISVKTVENQMTRALRQMRELLKKHHYLSIVMAYMTNS